MATLRDQRDYLVKFIPETRELREDYADEPHNFFGVG